jgi:hypothetical protein
MAMTTVSVTVPEENVADLYRYAADLVSGDADEEWEESEAEETNSNGKAKPGFGRATVRKSYLGGVSQVWRPMLEHLAEHAGEWVLWPDVCDAVNRTPRQMAGALGAAERRVNNKPPYEKRWNNGVREFRMNETVAEFIREVAEENA